MSHVLSLEGFHPTVATDAELVRYGFPPRPTRAADARLGRMWMATFGRDVSFTMAQLTTARHFASRPRQLSTVNSDNSTNWSGVVVHNQASDLINLGIAAAWIVPAITRVGDGTQSIGLWIGLDGYSLNTSGLLQAGIAGSFDEAGEPFFFAWSEWLSAAHPVQPSQTIANFSVQVGDMIEAQIWVTSPTTATVVMQNFSRSESTGGPVIVPLIAPSGVRVVGNDAEWIVERGDVDQALSTLPSYSPVDFTKAAAWSQSEHNASMAPSSFKAFALGSGFTAPLSARTVAASLDFPPPISLREMMDETAVVFPSSGETITMEEKGVPVSIANTQSKEVKFQQRYQMRHGKLT